MRAGIIKAMEHSSTQIIASLLYQTNKYSSASLMISAKGKRQKKTSFTYWRAYQDNLTEIYNRRFLGEERKRLNNEENLRISIIMGDVNGLKFINDGIGHSKGDEVLIEIAKICEFK